MGFQVQEEALDILAETEQLVFPGLLAPQDHRVHPVLQVHRASRVFLVHWVLLEAQELPDPSAHKDLPGYLEPLDSAVILVNKDSRVYQEQLDLKVSRERFVNCPHTKNCPKQSVVYTRACA